MYAQTCKYKLRDVINNKKQALKECVSILYRSLKFLIYYWLTVQAVYMLILEVLKCAICELSLNERFL